MTRWTEEQIEYIVKEYQDGKTTTHLANVFRVSHPTIRKLLIENGIKPRRKWAKKDRMCRWCHKIKSTDEFYEKDYICKECRPNYQKAKGYIYSRTKLGVSPDLARLIKSIQGDVCAICGEAPSIRDLSIDHNHITGEIRGALCSRCNTAIGLFQDKIDLLNKAIDYLQHAPFQKYVFGGLPLSIELILFVSETPGSVLPVVPGLR